MAKNFIGMQMINIGVAQSGMTSFADAIPATAEGNMRLACMDLEANIKMRAPVDTGHLRGSYGHQVHRRGDSVTGLVGSNVEYAAYQEFAGTPHVRPALDARHSSIMKMLGQDTLAGAMRHFRS